MRDCPSSEELSEFLSTALPDGLAATLRAHVLECDRCQDELDKLTDSETMDEWKTVARPAGTETARDETALLRLRQAMRVAPPESTIVGMEESAGTEAIAGTVDWPSILGAPERLGDLGTLGPYLVEAELGRGGMGIVLRAYDSALGRRVALKVLRPDLAHPRARRRLVREARAAAMFRHDHLVAVYAVVDPPEGLPYLVMEYLAGPTLGRLIEPGAGLEPDRATELIAQVADGLAAAHDAGLVHRDIKPDNIMIDPATGRAKLMDFGLARDEAGGESLTREDVLAGTPTHMSPEQALGQALDRRSDVYSLGVTLYQCLTGEVPFRGTPHMVIRQVCEDEPRPLRRLNDRIPRDLETICLKAMAKEPARRYPSARELAEDLRRWLRDEPIRAKPAGPIEHLVRWCRRNTRVAVMIATVIGLIVLLAVVSSVAAVRINRGQKRALQSEERRRQEAEQAAAHIAREQQQTLREHEAARNHYRLALETLNSLVTNVNQKLGSQPGTLQLKRDILETARAGLEKIARSTEAEGAIDPSAVTAYDQLGAVLFALGRTPDAIHAYERARDLATMRLQADPDSIELSRNLASALDHLGGMSRYGNDIPAAEVSFRRAMAVRDDLIARHGPSPDRLRDQHISSNNVGVIYLRRGEYARARAEFTRGLHLLEQYATSYPSQNTVATDYEYVYRHLAQCCLMSDWKAGGEYNRKALEMARKFVAADPGNLWLHKKLGIDLDQVADGLLLVGDLAGAEAHVLEAQHLRQADLAAEPGDVENLRGIAISQRRLGGLARYRHDFDAARRHYQECLSTCEALVRFDPGSAQKQGDILETYLDLADNADRAERFGEAAEWYEKSRQRLDQLDHEHHSGRATFARWRVLANMLWPLYQAAASGMQWDATSPLPDLPAPADLPPALHDGWHLLYATGLVRRGHHAEAAAIARTIHRHRLNLVLVQFRCTRVLALCAAAVAPGKSDDAISADECRLRQTYIDSARDCARQAVRLDLALAFDVFVDPDLEILRRRRILEAVARELGQTPAAEAAKR
jgi:tetratricopeptide (TPR) repeat protein